MTRDTGALLLLMACAAPEEVVPVFRIAGRVQVPPDVGPVFLTLDNLLITATDPLGDFKFDDVPNGRYTLTVQPSFETAEGVLGRGVDVNGADVDSLYFPLTPVGRVVGVVLDDRGRAVAGARVFAAGSASVTYSAADGAFSLEKVPLGPHTIVAQAVGFEAARAAGTVVSASVPSQVLLVVTEDETPDTNVPNEPPVITALRFWPKDNSDDNPRVIPAASLQFPELVHAGSVLELSVEAFDPEGEPLSFMWSADKGSLEGGDGPLVYWTAGNSEAEVVVVVFDERGASSTARQRLTLPKRTVRGATMYGHEVFYSESRQNDDRDLLGYHLDTGVERPIYAAVDEQHAPRVVGDTLIFADQVFTFVQPLVFRLRLLGLGPRAGVNMTLGQTLTPSDSFLIDYRLYSPLTDGRIAYFSSSTQLAPPGVGLLEPVGATYTPASALNVTPTPQYPCFAVHAGQYFGVAGMTLYRYPASAGVAVAALPGQSCVEMQLRHGRAAIRTDDVFAPLIIVDIATGNVVRVGTEVASFAMNEEWVAYTDKRGGVTGVYLRNLATGEDRTVAARGFFDRRVLELNDAFLLFGETDPATSISTYSSDSLLVFRLQD